MAETGWPIRNGKAGIITGDQASNNDQQESETSYDNRKPVMSGVIDRGIQNCSQ
jgi:hypothetical protein